MTTIQAKPKRSEELTKDEFRSFLRYVYSFPSKAHAALAVGVSRPTLDAVILKGTGKGQTIDRIREILGSTSAIV